jgi:hypothetical protein
VCLGIVVVIVAVGGCAEVKQYIQYSMVSKHHEEMGSGYG